MDWFVSLFTEQSVAHTIVLFGLVISIGYLLGKVKIGGISLGITWVLFVGILVSHFGMNVDEHTLHFTKEFGLILFVFSIGLQVGPGFFSSFRKDGLKLNLLATGIVVLGVSMALVFHFVNDVPMPTIVGILSGAITNTPGLGAAQEAYHQMYNTTDPNIALGYAAAYPLGVVGIISATLLIRFFFKVKLEKERIRVEEKNQESSNFTLMSVRILNPSIENRTIQQILADINRHFIITRVCKPTGEIFLCNKETLINKGDIVYVASELIDKESIRVFLGEEVEMDCNQNSGNLVSRRIVVTKDAVNGKTLGSLLLRKSYNINITRINRAGVDFLAHSSVVLQLGDRVMVVGPENAVQNVEKILGNSLKKLDHPAIGTLFLGIGLGVLLDSIPIVFPGIPQPVKLGLAGGGLIVAILIGRFGAKLHLNTYSTMSANLMLREVGITMFLASVGLASGEKFADTVFTAQGLEWIAMGVAITMIPILIIGSIGRGLLKMDFFELAGLLAGSTTDPPALAYANESTNSDRPGIAYSTVYPLTMFLRVLSAQILILLFC